MLLPVRASALGSSRAAADGDDPSADALFYAIRNRNFVLAKRLVDEGADLTCVRNERTPLALAVEMGCESAVRMFAQLGADVSSGPSGLDSPLLVAVKAGDLGIVKLLLELGADPDGKGVSCLDSGRM